VGERNLEQGLCAVFTGDGKGKTTASPWSGVLPSPRRRAGCRVPFIKGAGSGEAKALEIRRCLVCSRWGSFTWKTQTATADLAIVQEAWQQSLLPLADGQRKLVVQR